MTNCTTIINRDWCRTNFYLNTQWNIPKLSYIVHRTTKNTATLKISQNGAETTQHCPSLYGSAILSLDGESEERNPSTYIAAWKVLSHIMHAEMCFSVIISQSCYTLPGFVCDILWRTGFVNYVNLKKWLAYPFEGSLLLACNYVFRLVYVFVSAPSTVSYNAVICIEIT